MPPIPDVDVLLLLATTLAAKRRPAEPVEIMAAVDLLQGNIPSEEKLSAAFSRLGQQGLLAESEGRLSLTAAAESMVKTLPPKGETGERLLDLKILLAAHTSSGNGTTIELSPEHLRSAILAHRAAGEGAGKNLLMPKPKPVDGSQQRPGQRRRKPLPAARRKR